MFVALIFLVFELIKNLNQKFNPVKTGSIEKCYKKISEYAGSISFELSISDAKATL